MSPFRVALSWLCDMMSPFARQDGMHGSYRWDAFIDFYFNEGL